MLKHGKTGRSIGIARVVALVAVAVVAGAAGYQAIIGYPFLSRKLQGKAPDCSWWDVVRGTRVILRFDHLIETTALSLREKAQDSSLGIILVGSPERDFWIRREGEEYDGLQLLAYLLAEHHWMEELNPSETVTKGDVVLDCGAHVGVFTHRALRLGAARVLAVEPDPVNLECLRRNFPKEIVAGKVVVIPKAVWDREGTIQFSDSHQNSGSSAVAPDGKGGIEVRTTTIDQLAAEFGRISYIKMDIEGAERQALAGARNTLRKYKPRLAIEAYHLPDDGRVLPSAILAANPDYSVDCGFCGIMHDKVVPYIFYGR